MTHCGTSSTTKRVTRNFVFVVSVSLAISQMEQGLMATMRSPLSGWGSSADAWLSTSFYVTHREPLVCSLLRQQSQQVRCLCMYIKGHTSHDIHCMTCITRHTLHHIHCTTYIARHTHKYRGCDLEVSVNTSELRRSVHTCSQCIQPCDRTFIIRWWIRNDSQKKKKSGRDHPEKKEKKTCVPIWILGR